MTQMTDLNPQMTDLNPSKWKMHIDYINVQAVVHIDYKIAQFLITSFYELVITIV
jgi:hypothetical protein